MTCQKLMATELYRQLAVREDGFSIEPEVAAGLVLRGARIHEVPVPYRARRREEGKKLTALDGLRVLRTLLRCRLRGG
jgi:dolichol-phosphate hexosyltransferase